ncbi:hypothetical protein EMIT0P395_150164 [Pseudomonas sp. IT-P395]
MIIRILPPGFKIKIIINDLSIRLTFIDNWAAPNIQINFYPSKIIHHWNCIQVFFFYRAHAYSLQKPVEAPQ